MLEPTSSVEDTAVSARTCGTASQGLGRIEARKSALRARHARINTEIMVEQQRPLPDSLLLLSLKRIRLQIKDELRRLEILARRPARRSRTRNSPKAAPEFLPAA
jgi:hypothetical protein